MDQSTGITTAQARELSVLWTKAHPIVSTYLRACLCDFHRAEDLLQETAAAAAESFHAYDAARSFTGWVLGIARHKLLEHYRRHAKDRHLFDDQAVRTLAEVCADMEPELSAMHVALEQCIERVHGRPRKLLEMRYVRELTPRAIGEKTGMNANAVSVMLHRARRALRDCIDRQLAAQAAARAT